jgi:hypothetical protein
MLSLLAVVKSATEYSIDVTAIWDGFRFVIGAGVMFIAITAGIVFYRKLIS